MWLSSNEERKLKKNESINQNLEVKVEMQKIWEFFQLIALELFRREQIPISPDYIYSF